MFKKKSAYVALAIICFLFKNEYSHAQAISTNNSLQSNSKIFIGNELKHTLKVLPTDLKDEACSKNKALAKVKFETKYVDVDTGLFENFYLKEPDKKFSSINTVKITNDRLDIDINNKRQHLEYTAPIVDIIYETHYEATPISTAVATTLMLGLNLLLLPKETGQKAFG